MQSFKVSWESFLTVGFYDFTIVRFVNVQDNRGPGLGDFLLPISIFFIIGFELISKSSQVVSQKLLHNQV